MRNKSLLQEKFKKKYAFVFLSALLAALAIFAIVIHFRQYNISGTYAYNANNPYDDIYLVLQNEYFVISNPEKVIEQGIFKKLEVSGANLYELCSDISDWKGYVIHIKNDILLLNFKEMEVELKKISDTAIVQSEIMQNNRDGNL